jgi:hypothetical protein
MSFRIAVRLIGEEEVAHSAAYSSWDSANYMVGDLYATEPVDAHWWVEVDCPKHSWCTSSWGVCDQCAWDTLIENTI